MFSQGQLVFAGCFFVAFVIAMIYAYRKPTPPNGQRTSRRRVGFAVVRAQPSRFLPFGPHGTRLNGQPSNIARFGAVAATIRGIVAN